MRIERRLLAAVSLALLLAGCAAYSGSGLRAGVASEADVTGVMGRPAMSWALPDGSRQLAYPRGPAGVHTYMVRIDPRGRLVSIDNVLVPEAFAKIQPGMTQDEVLQILGPSDPSWTEYFAARDELVWEWRYCDSWGEAERFDVLFDGTAKTVRSSYSRPESSFKWGRVGCSR